MDARSDKHRKDPDIAASRPTPMMAQYLEIKAANPDCLLFYRMGDFYELFFADAEVASRALGIVLTKRGKHEGDDIRMCGVPVERADDYLNRLIALGHRVAVCEQIEDPAEAKKRGAKSVVKREVIRLVTPGTITEERLLEPGRARLLVAVQRIRANDARKVTASRRSTSRPARLRSSRRTRPASPRSLRASSRARSSLRRRSTTNRLFSQTIREMRVPATPLAREAAMAPRPSVGSANSMGSRRSTALARSPAPKSPPPRWRSPTSSAPSSRRGRRCRPRPGARAARASKSIPRPAPISSSPGRSAARARARCWRRSTSP